MGIPCVIITAYPSVDAARMALRSRGEEALAIDFVPKSEGPQALLDAIILVLSRQKAEQEPAEELAVDLDKRLVWRRNQPILLTQIQYDLLDYFYRNKGRVCRPKEIIAAVYGQEMTNTVANADKGLRNLIERLQKIIEDDPEAPRFLVKVPRQGYRLNTRPDQPEGPPQERVSQ
jgi:two-component system KDP operon response regulator KdpE